MRKTNVRELTKQTRHFNHKTTIILTKTTPCTLNSLAPLAVCFYVLLRSVIQWNKSWSFWGDRI